MKRYVGYFFLGLIVMGIVLSGRGGCGTQSGTLDTTFGIKGIVTTDVGGNDFANDLAIQPDGKIVVAGGLNGDFAIVRYNADGTLDPTFGIGGIVITDIGGNAFANALAIQPDGKIVVAGNFYYTYYRDFHYIYRGEEHIGSDPVGNYGFAVVRYNPDGTLDTTFGKGGIVIIDIEEIGDEKANALAIQPDGKIVVAGYSGGGFVVVRYNPDGTLDTTFGKGGIVKTNTIMGPGEAYALGIQPDGKIVAAGCFYHRYYDDTGSYTFAVVRYNPDGTLDTTFGEDGIVTTSFGDKAYALAIQPDGKIVVTGSADGSFGIVRYNADGSLDTTFGTNGIVTTNIGTGPSEAHALAIQEDGKIVVAGYSYNSGIEKDFAIVRYYPYGTLDTTFGRGGIVKTDIGTNSWDGATALTIQPDGKIVVAGYSGGGFVVVRYLP